MRRAAPDPGLTPVAEPGRLRIFVPAVLRNDSQTGGSHWAPKAGRARTQIDAVCAAVLAVLRAHRMTLTAPPARPKRIEFTAYHPPPAFDEPDGLTAAVKHIRDGLIHAGLLNNDAPRDGHTFRYRQVLTRDRTARGVVVDITLAETAGVLEALRGVERDPSHRPGNMSGGSPLGP